MTEYIPSTTEWVRDQVTLYEESNGKEGYELRGLPVIIATQCAIGTGIRTIGATLISLSIWQSSCISLRSREPCSESITT